MRTRTTRFTLLLAALVGAVPLAVASAAGPTGIGRMVVTPTTLTAGTTGNELTFAFTANRSLSGQTIVDVPRGWSVPQRRNAASPGYVELKRGTCGGSTRIAAIASRRLTIATNCKRGHGYELLYHKATVPTIAADGYIFLTQTRASGRIAKFRPLARSGQPGVKVKGGAAPVVALDDRRDRHAGIVREDQELEVFRRDYPLLERPRRDPVQQRLPVAAAEEDDREVEHLAGLDQRQRLEQLVERAEAAREDHEALGRLHEHRLARVEVVEGEADVDVRVRVLLMRQLDVEADREPAALARAAVRGLHHARPAARDDGEPRLGEALPHLARLPVGRVLLVDPGRAEDSDPGPADPLDRGEALEELVRDPRDVPGEVAVAALEEPAVLH